MSKLLVDALEQIGNLRPQGPVGRIARTALKEHRASSLVDDAELRAKLAVSIPGSWADAVLRIVSEHLGRGQR